MRSAFSATLLLVLVFACPRGANAGPILDFSVASNGTVTNLGPAALLPGGIIAYAFAQTGPGGAWEFSTLIARNEGFEDAGLGVCSEPSGCNIGGLGGGDNNELSQLVNTELILLQRPANMLWSGLWLSSLDAQGTSPLSERGQLFWTNEAATILFGPFNFEYPEFGGVDVFGQLALPQEFDPASLFLFFLPGGAVGDNNDYLVWGADLQPPSEVPEPGTLTLMLLGGGLCGLARRRYRSKRT